MLPRDNLLGEVVIPGLRASNTHDVFVAFFESGALRDMAGGLAEFIQKPNARMRIMVNPFLSADDQSAISWGLSSDPESLANRLTEVLGSSRITESALATYTLSCLAYLVARQRVQFKVVLVKNGLFHPKIRIFSDGDSTLVISGSNNLTSAAHTRNIEQVVLFRSWVEPELGPVQRFVNEFEEFWVGKIPSDVRVIPIADALAKKLLCDYQPMSAPSVSGFHHALATDKANGLIEDFESYINHELVSSLETAFSIPPGLNFTSGRYEHQGRAINAWEAAGGRGILEMATGAGKTKTSLIAARRLLDRSNPLLIVIAAPFRPLVAQWAREAAEFELAPVLVGDQSGRKAKFHVVQSALRRLRQHRSIVECLVVTHDLLCDPDFTASLDSWNGEKLLIADEVHNLGRQTFLANPPDAFQYRLGLSATPERQYDEAGSEFLIDFFGPVVFEFTLKDAIGVCLVPYDYFVHPVRLNENEATEWRRLSERLRQLGWSADRSDRETSNDVQRILNRRRKVVEQAESKIDALEVCLRSIGCRNVKHTLIYASDKGRAQLDSVNKLLISLGITFHQVTSEESSNQEIMAGLLKRFAEEDIQVLTAMRVLDEGVDIPETATGFILASNTVERQWVQRRGRMLRTCSRTGKLHATIHDFLVLPPAEADGRDSEHDAKKIVLSELHRLQAFAETARNASSPKGPLHLIHKLVIKYA